MFWESDSEVMSGRESRSRARPLFSGTEIPYALRQEAVLSLHVGLPASQFTAEKAADRLDRLLAERFPEFSRARLQTFIKNGNVTVNGQPSRASARVEIGDEILLAPPAPEPAEALPQDIPLPILFEDRHLIVIDKPAGLVVHPAVGNRDGTVVNALLHHCEELSGIGGVERPGIVHRLDKETSGCLVVAKDDPTHRGLVELFAGREICKIYLALCQGRLRLRSGSIREPIGRHPVQRQKMAVSATGRPAHTDYRVLADLSCGSLVECTLHTGRTHQIRVHLKHLGHPVLGDAIYGKRGDFPRQMLHAWKMGFTHPITGEKLAFASAIPADFIAAGVPAQLP